MKYLITFLIICISSISILNAQTDSISTDCINFDEYNMCYNIANQRSSGKAGKVCSINDLIKNEIDFSIDIEVLSFDVYVTVKGQLFVNRQNQSPFVPMVKKVIASLEPNEEFIVIIDNVKASFEGMPISYPSITIKSCE